MHRSKCSFFFFNDTATTEIYTLSLHDALPILELQRLTGMRPGEVCVMTPADIDHQWRVLKDDEGRLCSAWLYTPGRQDRKSTRLNSSHSQISYAVFCLKKKNKPTRRGYAKDLN